MKNIKRVGLIVVTVLAVFYIVYLLILPNVINLSFVKDMAKQIAKEQASVDVSIGDIKLKTGFPLNAGVEVNNVELVCVNKTKPFVLEKASANVNLLPLLFKKIQLKDVFLGKIVASTEVDKNGKYAIENCFAFSESSQANTENTNPQLPFSIDEKLPVVVVQDVNLSLKDLETNNTLSLNIAEFKLDKAVLNEKFRISAVGKLLLNEKDNITFDVKLDSFMPELSFSNSEQTTQQTGEYFNFIKTFAEYNLLADIKTDLKISLKNNKLMLNGIANVDGLSFKIDNEQLPVSYLHSEFNPKENKLDSRIYLSSNESFSLSSVFKNSEKLNLDAKFLTDKISFKNIQKIAVALMNTFNIPNAFANLKTDGYIISNLNFKTDTESFVSDGSFRVADGEISLADIGLFIKEINSNIDFKDNALQINKTSALVNGALFDVKGAINSAAVADITVSANKLPVAKLAEAFLTGDLKKNYEIKNGFLDLEMLIKGKLDSIKPSVDVSLASFELLDKVNKMTFSNANTLVNIKTDGIDFSGEVVAQNTKLNVADLGIKLSLPELKIDISPKEIKINEADILLNNSRLYLDGLISNYLSTPNIDIKINGDLQAQDIKKLLPADIVANTTAKGKLPMLLSIKGAKDLKADVILVADKDNYFDIIKSKNLIDKNTAFFASIKLSGSDILIENAGIFTSKPLAQEKATISSWKSDEQYVTITGSLVNNGQVFKNLKVIVDDAIDVSVLGISTDVRTELTIDGNIAKPQIKGYINLSKINAPDYLITAQMLNANITPALINADILGLNLNGSVVDAKILAPTSFDMPFVVSSVEANSNFIDLDKILVITTKFPQSEPSSNNTTVFNNTPMIPVTIQKGIAKLGGFKVGTLGTDAVATNFTLKDDVLKLSNLKGKAYSGDLSGSVDYNLKTLEMMAKLKGENMEANPAVTALLAIKDQIMGTLKFNADFSFKGATMEEQLKSMKGTADFEVKDGQLGSLGRFETYLKAANIISSKFIQSSINTIINLVLPYNSGQIALATGKLSFDNGNVKFDSIETSGKEMALKVTGFLNMLNYNGKIQIKGRLNQEMVNILGPLSDISVDKVLAFIPKVGVTASAMFNSLNTKASDSEMANIPKLTPDANSKTFKVVMEGNLMTPNAVKSFQWLASEEVLDSTEASISNELNTPDVTNTVNQATTKIQTQTQEKIIQAQEKINQTVENNATLKKIKTFGEFLKTTQSEQQVEE